MLVELSMQQLCNKSMTRENNSQLEWLASLRGLAALLVFLSHLFIVPVSRSFLFALGRIGVVCFFFITGYLAIPSRVKRTRKQYLINRFIRLYPVYWFLLLLMFFINQDVYTFKQLVANFTEFQEFLGFKNIIGASWMLPIQVIFIGLVLVFDVKFFINGNSIHEVIKRGFFLTIICSTLALFTAILRYFTGKPFPSAIFLLNGVSIIGIYYWFLQGELVKLKFLFIIYEVGLFLAVPLSYPNKIIEYISAYNIGILVFIVFAKFIKGNSKVSYFLKKIGEIGFTFFLGADIVYILYFRYFSPINTNVDIIIALMIKFVGSVLLGLVVTNFIEKPLQKWGKKVEEELI